VCQFIKLYASIEFILYSFYSEKITYIRNNILGRAVEWLNTAKEIPSIIRRLSKVLKKLVKSVAGRKRRDLESKMSAALSDGIGDMVT
jgi:hypothetical protein